MKVIVQRRAAETGSALVAAVVFSFLVMLAITSTMQLSAYRVRLEHGRAHSQQAYFHAENALNWICQAIADSAQGGATAPFLGHYSVRDGTLHLTYQEGLKDGEDPLFGDTWVTVQNHPSGLTNLYLVTASSKEGNRTRTLQATVRKNPPSLVFDYEYFLNNWGWWWGSSITGNGDNRANWDFDFQYGPTVNGSVLANGRIESAMQPVDPLAGNPPFRGLAGNEPVDYIKTGVPRVSMPNLLDFSYYIQKAQDAGGKLYVGNTLKVNAVHNDSTKPGLALVGTTAEPIRIDGPVVIPGDVVIKGVISGTGTLYVGGNLYVAGDVTYKDGPSFYSPPTLMSDSQRDAWVENAVDQHKDLVAFAVNESILGGDVNSSDWKSRCYDAAYYGLKNVGNEAALGEDGIPGTPDDGVAYLDTNGDGQPDSAWYDADGDGATDYNYNYTQQIQMNSTRVGKITDYPTDHGEPESYNAVASNNMNRLDGIFYCNHAVGMRLAKNNSVMNGALICRDEAIVYNSTLKFNYDPRVHSRYSDDPNRFIDLGLPIARKVRIEHFAELAPQEGFFSSDAM